MSEYRIEITLFMSLTSSSFENALCLFHRLRLSSDPFFKISENPEKVSQVVFCHNLVLKFLCMKTALERQIV